MRPSHALRHKDQNLSPLWLKDRKKGDSEDTFDANSSGYCALFSAGLAWGNRGSTTSREMDGRRARKSSASRRKAIFAAFALVFGVRQTFEIPSVYEQTPPIHRLRWPEPGYALQKEQKPLSRQQISTISSSCPAQVLCSTPANPRHANLPVLPVLPPPYEEQDSTPLWQEHDSRGK